MQSVTFRYTEADLLDARRYAYNTVPLVRVVRWVPIVMVLIGVLLGAAFAFQQNWDALIGLWGWMTIGVLLLFWKFVVDRWILPRSVRKSLARDKGFQDDQAVEWDAERFLMTSSHGQSRWPWGDLAKWQESPGGLLLYQNPRSCNYLPKRSLTDGQLVEIRGLLTAAVGKAGKARK
jgi:hypothetical protein